MNAISLGIQNNWSLSKPIIVQGGDQLHVLVIGEGYAPLFLWVFIFLDTPHR